MNTVACRSCGARIGFIETPTGKHMPVDPELVKTYMVSAFPHRARLVLVTERGDIHKGFEVSATDPGATAVEGYVPHWATCTDPGAHRR